MIRRALDLKIEREDFNMTKELVCFVSILAMAIYFCVYLYKARMLKESLIVLGAACAITAVGNLLVTHFATFFVVASAILFTAGAWDCLVHKKEYKDGLFLFLCVGTEWFVCSMAFNFVTKGSAAAIEIMRNQESALYYAAPVLASFWLLWCVFVPIRAEISAKEEKREAVEK